MRYTMRVLGLAFLVPLFGCSQILGIDEPHVGGDDDDDPPGCPDGQVPEPVVGEFEPFCFKPVFVRGTVKDEVDGVGIAGARVVGLSEVGVALTDAAVAGADGTYELRVPNLRHPDGSPVGVDVLLRVDAPGHLGAPGRLAPAPRIGTAAALEAEDGWLLNDKDVALRPRAPDGGGTASLHGSVADHDPDLGLVVVAESGGVGREAFVGRDGSFAIFDLGAGEYHVVAYASGQVFEERDVTLAAGATESVTLVPDTSAASARVTGDVAIAEAAGGMGTSVQLVVASTWDASLRRGVAVPGVRVPALGAPFSVVDDFVIEGVPPGRYRVVAAGEFDGLVPAPAACAAPDTPVVEVAAGDDVALAASIALVPALAITQAGPAGTILLTDGAGLHDYDLHVHDDLGGEAHHETYVGMPGPAVDLRFTRSTMVAGRYYQARVTPIAEGCPLPESEDPRGTYRYSPR